MNDNPLLYFGKPREVILKTALQTWHERNNLKKEVRFFKLLSLGLFFVCLAQGLWIFA